MKKATTSDLTCLWCHIFFPIVCQWHFTFMKFSRWDYSRLDVIFCYHNISTFIIYSYTWQGKIVWIRYLKSFVFPEKNMKQILFLLFSSLSHNIFLDNIFPSTFPINFRLPISRCIVYNRRYCAEDILEKFSFNALILLLVAQCNNSCWCRYNTILTDRAIRKSSCYNTFYLILSLHQLIIFTVNTHYLVLWSVTVAWY